MLLKKGLLLLGLLGLGCVLYSLTLSYYTDPDKVNNLLDLTFSGTKINKDIYYDGIGELRTNKTDLLDLGSGILIASITLLYFTLFLRINTFSDIKKLHTCSRGRIFLITNISGLMMFPGTIWYYWYRLDRGDFPPFADSIGIPIAGGILMFLVLIILSNLFLLLFTRRAHLPVKLFICAKQYGFRAILVEIFFGLCFIMNLLLVFASIVDGDHFLIVFNLFYTYTFLVLRAGIIYKL